MFQNISFMADNIIKVVIEYWPILIPPALLIMSTYLSERDGRNTERSKLRDEYQKLFGILPSPHFSASDLRESIGIHETAYR
jgi:hypothetical protein